MDRIEDHGKQPNLVEESDRNDSPLETPPKRRTVIEKLGIYNIIILVLGTVAIFLALAFLLYFWVDSDNARKNGHYTQLWYQVVWNDWTPKVVTLSTVLIRLATGAQLGVFAALVAALILERVGAATADLPQLSIIRCANSGPHTLFRHIIHSIPVKSQWGYSIIIAITILNMAVMQLMSTILLTDLGDATILRKSLVDKVPFGLDFSGSADIKNTWAGIDYWTTGPATYPRFAEYTESGSRGAHYIDTGTAYRAFFPFASEFARSSIRDFEGPMPVVNTRTVCVKPSFSDVTYFDNNDTSIIPTVAGMLRFKGIPDVLLGNDNGIPFNCTVASPEVLPSIDSLIYWAMSLCFIRTNQTGWPPRSQYRDPWLTRAYLFLNMSFTGSTGYLPRGPVLTPVRLEQSETSDPVWAKFGHDNITFDGSVCFSDTRSEDHSAQALALDFEALLPDQRLSWNTSEKKYNVEAIVNTFGATEKNLTLVERGVYVLLADKLRDDTIADIKYNVTITPYLSIGVDKLFAISKTINSTAVKLTKYGNVHRSHTVIVQSILQNTRNPALALQALFTIILQMSYYDFFTEFDLLAPAKYSALLKVKIPVRWKGLGVILGLLGLHLAILLIVLMLFLAHTEMSLLGNAWQAISQVHSTDTADVVQKGAMATDKELINKKGKNDERVRIARSASSGRTEAMYVRRQQGAVEYIGTDRV